MHRLELGSNSQVPRVEFTGRFGNSQTPFHLGIENPQLFADVLKDILDLRHEQLPNIKLEFAAADSPHIPRDPDVVGKTKSVLKWQSVRIFPSRIYEGLSEGTIPIDLRGKGEIKKAKGFVPGNEIEQQKLLKVAALERGIAKILAHELRHVEHFREPTHQRRALVSIGIVWGSLGTSILFPDLRIPAAAIVTARTMSTRRYRKQFGTYTEEVAEATERDKELVEDFANFIVVQPTKDF